MLDKRNPDWFDFKTAHHSIVLNLSETVFSPTGFAQSCARILEDKIPDNGHVCELGIGTGVLSILAGLKGATVVGLDRNLDAVALAHTNWLENNLPIENQDFRSSDLFSALTTENLNSFDLMWSNPPLLPELPDGIMPDNETYCHEVSGPLGRDVLDAMLVDARPYLKPGGSMLTIATSLQGWKQTKALLDQNWSKWSIIEEVELPLTDECGPEYVAWWRDEQKRNNETYVEQRGDEVFHKLWFIQAWNS